MGDVISWVLTHKGELLQAWLMVVGLASIVVKLTPTVKDDTALKALLQFIGKFVALDKYGPTPEDQAKANRG